MGKMYKGIKGIVFLSRKQKPNYTSLGSIQTDMKLPERKKKAISQRQLYIRLFLQVHQLQLDLLLLSL